jgi:hypothetical protein
MPAPAQVPVCHPYARISDPAQRKGGGLERQTAADVAEFCRRFGFTLAKRIRVDDGVSAFKGLNATPHHELGKFLVEARRGLIRPGDCLLLENWDRLSRQNIWAAIGLVNDLRELGIHVGRLDRMKLLRCDSTDPGDFFEAAVELMRGHSESAAKSMRNGAAWGRRRQRARAGENLLTRRLPAWVEERGGKLVPIPDRAALVRRIFRLAASGYGHGRIVGLLNREGVPAWGHRPRTKEQIAAEQGLPAEQRARLAPAEWQRQYVSKLLRDRRVLGEMQPCRHGKPDGAPVADYFPRVIDPDEWTAAQGPRRRVPARHPAGSKDGGGRPQGGRLRATRPRKPYQEGPRHINLFTGLLHDAAGGGAYVAGASEAGNGRGQLHRVYVTAASTHGRGPRRAFPLVPFEQGILSMLVEIDPREILNGRAGPDESFTLRQLHDGAEAELAEASAYMDAHGFSPTIARRITDLEARLADLAGRLAEARERAAHPLSETWGEFGSLAGALAGAPDPSDVRLRLRAALRRMVEGVWLLVVPRGLDRLCAAQVWFSGCEKHRDYVIHCRPAWANQTARHEGSWSARSFADVVKPAALDLRRREDAAELERLLNGLTLDASGVVE